MPDMLSQEDINALLNTNEDNSNTNYPERLTEQHKDALGEIGNISMGTAATTLYSLLNQKVLITTPSVKIMSWQEISNAYARPCVGVKIDYIFGIDGTNVLILKNKDVKIITDLMMGGNGQNITDNDNLTEIDMSAIGEAMNQMIGSASTSLASILNEKIDIAPPIASEITFEDEKAFERLGFGNENLIVAIIFRMQIGSLIDSQIMQLIPINFAVEMAEKMIKNWLPKKEKEDSVYDNYEDERYVKNYKEKDKELNINNGNNYYSNQNINNNNNYYSDQNVSSSNNLYSNENTNRFHNNTNVKTVEFQNFDYEDIKQQKENINILMDVPLDVTVELGKTSKRIKEILEFSVGTIIELDKLAGEPIDIVVNGEYVAKGEVVVIDENFAVRVTNINSKKLKI